MLWFRTGTGTFPCLNSITTGFWARWPLRPRAVLSVNYISGKANRQRLVQVTSGCSGKFKRKFFTQLLCNIKKPTAAINETLTWTVAFKALDRLHPRSQVCASDTAISRFRIGTKSSPRFDTFSTRDRTRLPVVPFSITTVHWKLNKKF